MTYYKEFWYIIVNVEVDTEYYNIENVYYDLIFFTLVTNIDLFSLTIVKDGRIIAELYTNTKEKVMSFLPFSQAVHAHIKEMTANSCLYQTNANGYDLWDIYLSSFPEGTNPIFRVNTEHDCSCCRHFIRNMGTLVAIVDGKMQNVWDIDTTGLAHEYQVVVQKMKEYMDKTTITSVFKTNMRKIGNEQTNERLENGDTINWNHFHGDVPSANYHADGSTISTIVGKNNTDVSVAIRSLKELKLSDIDNVLDLIDGGFLYRGSEHKNALTSFKKHLKACEGLTDSEIELYVWSNANTNVLYQMMIRSTVIGTLLVDLANDVSLEDSVRSFESKVAPQNYKRPKALITESMVKDAMATIESLGLEQSLERRLANINDVSVNDVLWAGSEMCVGERKTLTKALMALTNTSKPSKGKRISITEFIETVTPKASKIEAFIENNHVKNMVSITAPIHADSANMFKWDNKFGWSYTGNMTDSIKERVKNAGGNVAADVRFSLSWFNKDDLDLHCVTPSGERIYYGNKRGILDVDMNVSSINAVSDAVENLSFIKPVDGIYKVLVHNFTTRSRDDHGFILQVEDPSGITNYGYDHVVHGSEKVEFLFTLTNGVVTNVTLPKNTSTDGIATDKWNLKTGDWVNVRAIMNSPNHWGENEVGLRHWFFPLENCLVDEDMRGFYNEFLSNDLDKHRKVFEIIAGLNKCEKTNDQLSGLGFVETKNESLKLKATIDGAVRQYEVTF